MSELTIPERIAAALAALGESADAVAETLGREGCEGIRNKEDACPVFHYLSKQIPGVVAVDKESAWFTPAPMLADTPVLLPEPVARFVERFDHGAFEHLATGDDLDYLQGEGAVS